MTGDTIAGLPPTAIALPTGPGIADALLSPRLQCVPSLATLQQHFVATPDVLFDGAAAPAPPNANLPAFYPVPLEWAPWFLGAPMEPRSTLERLVNLTNLLSAANSPVASSLLQWARARCVHVPTYPMTPRNALKSAVLAHSPATIEWMSAHCRLFGFGQARPPAQVVASPSPQIFMGGAHKEPNIKHREDERLRSFTRFTCDE